MVEPSRYDVAVIGSGIGGYVSAIRSSQLGKTVVLFEKDALGGTCINRGCIPTKTLLATTNLLDKVAKAEELGLHAEGLSIDYGKLMAKKEAVVSRLTRGVEYLMKKNKIALVKGKAALVSRNQIRVQKPDGTEETCVADSIIVATGSEEPKPHYTIIDEKRILTSKGALSLTECPKSLAVVGCDMFGIELASFFRSLGSEVKVFESSPSLLPKLDVEVGKYCERVLKKGGVEVNLSTSIKSVNVEPDGKVAVTASVGGTETRVTVEKALIAEARRPATEGVGLEAVGVKLKDGFVEVDNHQRTSVPNIYAVGDVSGSKMLAHEALAEGIVAAENAAGKVTAMDHKTVPVCLYCEPEIACVGLSEDEAKQGHNVAVGKFQLLASGRALTLSETDGFAKVVCDKETGEILGVHLVGPHATEVISEAILAMKMECTCEELGGLVHPHPTIGEALMEAARAVSNKAIHV
jgi:dihydrolipoamide dehydrogenase